MNVIDVIVINIPGGNIHHQYVIYPFVLASANIPPHVGSPCDIPNMASPASVTIAFETESTKLASI